MYREAKLVVKAADDSTLVQKIADLSANIYQVKDLETFTTTVRVGPSDADAAVAIAPVTTGYFYAIFSDYPVRFRINGVGATQQTMKTNGTPATAVGAPAPYQCFACATAEVTSIYLQPIASAAQTANVKILVTGDPTSSYT